jgi:Tol biopolymer transport system component
MSDDGRYVAFTSYASNLVSGDTNAQADVFLRDMQNGTVHRVSLDAGGQQLVDASVLLGLSPDGQKVAFRTSAAGVVPGYVGINQRIVLREWQTGATTIANLMANGQLSNRISGVEALSANLRYIVFSEYETSGGCSRCRCRTTIRRLSELLCRTMGAGLHTHSSRLGQHYEPSSSMT